MDIGTAISSHNLPHSLYRSVKAYTTDFVGS